MPANNLLYNKIISLLDLTSLSENDDETSIIELCRKAEESPIPVAAVCLYPKFVKLASHLLKKTKIATVVNFPHGDHSLSDVTHEIETALSEGAHEIDMVFPYHTYLAGNKQTALNYVTTAKKIGGQKTLLKVIVETGALPSLEMIETITQDVIFANADFIKTSTGKIEYGATLSAVRSILNIIKNNANTFAVGLKVSGGIRTTEQAIGYVELAEEIMGRTWIQPMTFRIGTSKLLDELLS